MWHPNMPAKPPAPAHGTWLMGQDVPISLEDRSGSLQHQHAPHSEHQHYPQQHHVVDQLHPRQQQYAQHPHPHPQQQQQQQQQQQHLLPHGLQQHNAQQPQQQPQQNPPPQPHLPPQQPQTARRTVEQTDTMFAAVFPSLSVGATAFMPGDDQSGAALGYSAANAGATVGGSDSSGRNHLHVPLEQQMDHLTMRSKKVEGPSGVAAMPNAATSAGWFSSGEGMAGNLPAVPPAPADWMAENSLGGHAGTSSSSTKSWSSDVSFGTVPSLGGASAASWASVDASWAQPSLQSWSNGGDVYRDAHSNEKAEGRGSSATGGHRFQQQPQQQSGVWGTQLHAPTSQWSKQPGQSTW